MGVYIWELVTRPRLEDEGEGEGPTIHDESFNVTIREDGETETVQTYGRGLFDNEDLSDYFKQVLFYCLAYEPTERPGLRRLFQYINRGIDLTRQVTNNGQETRMWTWIVLNPPWPRLRDVSMIEPEIMTMNSRYVSTYLLLGLRFWIVNYADS